MAIGLALVLSLAFEVTPGWLGIALLGYGVAVWSIDRVVRGTGEAALWIARGTTVIGLVLAATDPIPAIVGWSLVLVAAAARAVMPDVRSATSVLLPPAREPAAWLAELWIPLFMVVGAGVARLVDAPFVPWVLLVAGGAAALTRWLPPSLRALRTYAVFPAAVLAIASLAAGTLVHFDVEPYEAGEAGALFLGFALVAAMTWIRWMWRSPLVVAATVAGVVLLIVEWVEPGRSGIIMAETVLLIAAGALLVAASHAPVWRHWAYANGLLGTICLYSAVAVGMLTEDSMLVALSALVVSHASEAIAAHRGTSPFIADAAELAGTHRAVVEGAPATIAAIAALPLALLIGRRIPWLSDERPRSALVLVSLSLLYTASAFYLRRPARWILVGLAYLSATVAIGVAFPSRPASLAAVGGAAVVTFGLAVCVRRPGLSTPSWLLAVVGVVLAAAQLGVDQDALYRPLFVAAIALTVVGGALSIRDG